MKKAVAFVILIMVFTACKKNVTNDPPVTNTNPVINSNVRVIDSTKLILNSDSTFLSQGKYEFTFTGAAPEIKINDVIVGPTNGGYIRKVSASTIQANKIILETTQGNMEDVFKRASFNFNMNSEGLARVQGGYQYDLSNLILFQDGGLTIKITTGSIKFDADWKFDFKFKDSKLDSFEMSCQNVVLESQFNFNLSTAQIANLANHISSLKKVSKNFIFWVPAGPITIPVVLTMDLDFICKFSLTTGGSINKDVSVSTLNTTELAIKYVNSQWQTNYNSVHSLNILSPASSGSVNLTANFGLLPTVSIKLYGIAGPYASVGLKELVKGSIATPGALDWDFYAGAWINTVLGAQAKIFSNSVFDFSKEWNTDTLHYETPYRIDKISGDNQMGQINQQLPLPIKVKISDNNNGSPQIGVPVYFTITNGGGSVNNAMAFTDASGFAQTLWTMGGQPGISTLSIKAKKADGTLLQNAPVEFAAITNQSIAVLTTTFPSSVATTTATSGGNITSNGGSAITGRGICYSLNPNPTTANSTVASGSGTGSFISNIIGLVAGTSYYVRAYAINSVGTAYGNEVSFTTQQAANLSSVTIGSQIWTDQNLDVATYRNGDIIPQVTDSTQWVNLTTGAWCYYNNDPAIGPLYSKMYNYYAINDPRGLAPAGWHVPSDAEWTTVTTFLGGESIAGGKMKALILWNSPNTGATNSSGFSGLPGGYRHENSTFISLTTEGIWWSSTENGAAAWRRNMYANQSAVGRGSNDKKMACSVRCIKD